MRTIYVRIGYNDHTKFKKLCQRNDVFMADIIRDFIKKLVEDFKEEKDK